MAGFGAISYAAVGVSYATLSVMLLISWRGKHPGGYLIAACLISAVWAIMLSVQTANTFVPVMAMFAVEVLRDRAWLTFLMALAAQIGVSHQLRYLMHAVWISVLVVGIVWWLGQDYFGPTINVGAVAIPSGLAMALAGLLLIEQLYKISPLESRWSIKPLALGVGGLFAYVLFLFSQGMLLGALDTATWMARGAVNILFIPLIAMAARRNLDWDLRIFVSRQVVFIQRR